WIRNSLPDPKRFVNDFELTDPFEVALELPRGVGTWQLLIERCESGWAMLMLDDSDVVSFEVVSERPKSRELNAFVMDAIAQPAFGSPRKPESIAVTTKATQNVIAKSCATVEVEVSQRKMSRDERASIKSLIAEVSKHAFRSEPNDSIEDFLATPIVEAIWVLGVFRPPIWIESGATPTRHFLTLILCAEQGTILGHQMVPELPSREELASLVRGTMVAPAVGAPRRPETVLLDPKSSVLFDDDLTSKLTSDLPGVTVVPGDDSLKSAFDVVVADMLLAGSPVEQSFRDLEGVDDALLEELYRVVANFYRSKPWKMVIGDRFIRVVNHAWKTPERAACVMGQLGQSLGLCLLDDIESAQRLLKGDNRAMADGSVSLEFGEAFEAIPVDLWYQERMNWELAGPEAYPCLFRIGSALKPAPLTAEDVHVLIQVLPQIPRFLDHPVGETFEMCNEDQRLELSWLH
ncbi:MAG: hypothetical protein AAFX06_28595, partial [Planctomycetota bacterium]